VARDLPIERFLRDLGFQTDSAQAAARAVLEEVGITRPGKRRIVEWKQEEAAAAISARLTLLCEACRAAGLAEDVDVATAIPAGPGDRCAVCSGSSNRRGALAFVRACGRAGHHRIVMVGGSDDIRRELPGLLGADLDLRLVDGTVSRPRRDAQRDVDGADLVVLLGSTQLDHTVSAVYSGPKAIVTNQRGIGAFLTEAAGKVAGRAAR
jgi:hypothetical protein